MQINIGILANPYKKQILILEIKKNGYAMKTKLITPQMFVQTCAPRHARARRGNNKKIMKNHNRNINNKNNKTKCNNHNNINNTNQ